MDFSAYSIYEEKIGSTKTHFMKVNLTFATLATLDPENGSRALETALDFSMRFFQHHPLTGKILDRLTLKGKTDLRKLIL